MKLPQHVEKVGTLTGHSGAIYDIIFFQNFFYTASADKFVVKWDIRNSQQSDFTVKLERSAYNIAFSPKSNLLAIGTNNGEIHVIDVQLRKEIRLLAQHKSSVFSIAYCEHTNRFYSGDREGYFCAWDATNFDLLISLPYDCGKIREIAVNEDGKFIALCGEDGYIRILETDFFNLVHQFKAHTDGANCALFDQDILYTGGKDAHIKQWNWKEERLLKSIPGHNFAVYDLAFLKEKSLIVSVSFDKSIKLWNKEDLSILERIEFRNGGHRHVVNRIAVVDDESFATISDDRKILIWKLKD